MTAAQALPTSATAIARAVAVGDLSAREVAVAALDRIATEDSRIGAFTDVTAARALAEAEAVDRARAAGEPLGPLAGVPFAVKNLFDLAGLPTRAGSRINRDHPPAATDAALVARMTRAGAVTLGGLNMGEYAYDFTGENAHDGPSRNPHDPTRMSGGSSGGCGAAIAAGFAPLALGSDTNGSIRVPSALCGVFGLKPTYGRLTRAGAFPFCDSLDHLGPFARSAGDLALCYDALQAADGLDAAGTDAAWAGRPPEPTLPELAKGVEGLRVAVAGGYFRQGATAQALDAVDRVARALSAGREVEYPDAQRARAAAFLITNAESAAFHLDRLRSRAAEFDPDTRDRFLAGAMLPAVWLAKAQRFRRWHHDRALELFAGVDLILAPCTPCAAPRLGQKTMMLNGAEVAVRPNLGLYTQPVSFIGLPVAAVPVWGDADAPNPLPVGVQIIAAPWREDLCLRAAAAVEAMGVARAPMASLPAARPDALTP
ncbi:AtzE family amidohydrolase [Azospirillum griseum]|uniref:AtzE family amidohydrolase n=1 Tax=Azospirillum griseum TaxID=2496639 RepID=A0A3S0R6P5_9PROT|nr:AtzE family amidohydrolase [Azospirillum griseum]RTR16898.1 AtzE family amidohydrolase [Azospirillum griseum]